MKKYIIYLGIIYINTLCNITKVSAQKNKVLAIEDELVALSEKAHSFIYNNDDSVTYYGNLFSATLEHYIISNPSTVSSTFQLLQDKTSVRIVSSSDKNLRIYSWDDFSTGTMKFFKVLFQYKVGKDIKTELLQDSTTDPSDPLYFFSEIFTVQSKQKTIYLAVSNAVYSNKDLNQSIQAFTIENEQLNSSIEVFKTTSLSLNKISVDFDFFSVVDREERPLQLITYDEKDKIVNIPIVTKEGFVTPRFIVYKFDGSNFVHQKISTKKTK